MNFIKSQFPQKEQEDKNFKYGIEMLEQYFHLEGENDEYECTKDNLTEIFWDVDGVGEKIKGIVQGIKEYFYTIMNCEYILRNAFKKYYEAKKTKKEEIENVENKVIEEIMKECCGKEEGDNIPTKFFGNLKKLCDNDQNLKGNKEAILAAIQRRITLNDQIKEEDIKSFLKQKIGEDKKEVEQKIEEGGCCPCCDCWGKKKNPEVEVEESQHEI